MCIRDGRIFRNGSEWIFEYIRQTETSLNKFQIYLNNLNFQEQIFEYNRGPKFTDIQIYSGQKVKKMENMFLKKLHLGEYETI